MAKPTNKKLKKAIKTVAKKAVKKAAKPKVTATPLSIEEAAVAAKDKLSKLEIEHQLQADLDWCLGSYRFDGQPMGLYHYINMAIDVLKAELSKKKKGITAKFISTLETAVK